MVSRMALQAQRRLADQQQTPLHGTVRCMAFGAAFYHRCVLVCEWPLELGVTLKAEFIEIGRAKIIGSSSTVWVVAVRATHLRFANRVMIREPALRLLLAVASYARIDPLMPGGQLRLGGVHLVTINTAHVMRLVRAGRPVLQLFVSGMTPETDAVCLFGFHFTELDDISVRVAADVLAARAVAVFTLQLLLRVVATTERFGLFFMARATLVGTQPLRTWNLYIFREPLLAILMLIGV
jgi:hypothetical protein